MSARAIAASSTALEAADLRFGQVGIANVRVRKDDPGALRAALEIRVREAPQLFERAPVVVDLSFLAPLPADADVMALLDAVRAAGMLPVGLAYGDAATDALARRIGLPLIAKFRAAYARTDGGAQAARPAAKGHAEPAPAPAPQAAAPATATAALQHQGSVRTGQQVYAQGRDLVVVGQVANGAELLADGNIHVYGTLRGRVFAGAQGDESARIFCSAFNAEIVSIAGHYRVFEELPADLAGRAAQVWLEQGKLQLAAL